VGKLCAWQREERLDAVVIASAVNRYYFTGIETSDGWLVSEREGPAFYTDFRYLTMARQCLKFMPTRKVWRPGEEADAWARMGRSWRRVGFEGSLSAAQFNRLKAALPNVEWIDVSTGLTAFRSVKSRAEQQLIRRAVAANDQLFAELLRTIAVGVSEWDVRTFVRRAADLLGEGEAFDTIACVGRHSAECHHHPDQTVLKREQPLLVDLGVKVNRYCSDMTRSLFFGSPPPLYREIHALVLAANRKAIRGIRPGRRCDDIDDIARSHIAKAGYGDYFGHGLGHSLGLEIHETPSFSPSCKAVLKPGMVLTVEPGVYLPGRFGVRIEDVVLVTNSGCEVLSQTPRDLSY
jgi:Xaa-Pro aminopeptidase